MDKWMPPAWQLRKSAVGREGPPLTTVRKLKRAQILLAADAGVSDEAIASSVSVGGSTVYRTKRRFVEGNLELALSEETRAPGHHASCPVRKRRCWCDRLLQSARGTQT
jgi:Homeodomain-like domain